MTLRVTAPDSVFAVRHTQMPFPKEHRWDGASQTRETLKAKIREVDSKNETIE